MKNRISKSHFKAKALELLRTIEETREAIVVTDRGEPALEIRRFSPPPADPLATLRGSVLHYDNTAVPIGDDDWEAIR